MPWHDLAPPTTADPDALHHVAARLDQLAAEFAALRNVGVTRVRASAREFSELLWAPIAAQADVHRIAADKVVESLSYGADVTRSWALDVLEYLRRRADLAGRAADLGPEPGPLAPDQEAYWDGLLELNLTARDHYRWFADRAGLRGDQLAEGPTAENLSHLRREDASAVDRNLEFGYDKTYPVFEGATYDEAVRAAQELTLRIRRRPNDYFPFDVKLADCAQGDCSVAISEGNRLSLGHLGEILTPGRAVNIGDVHVTAVNDLGWTFEAADGHIAEGGTIQFMMVPSAELPGRGSKVEMHFISHVAGRGIEGQAPGFLVDVFGELIWTRFVLNIANQERR
jgi:hypothetical protein